MTLSVLLCAMLFVFVSYGHEKGSAPAIRESVLTDEERSQLNSKQISEKENEYDREVLSQKYFDFSDVSIAFLGDSITEGINGATGHANGLTYPEVVKEVLGAREVYNLGIGGSTIGDYWANAMVNRYQEIPYDTDIIVVFGGLNDVFSGTEITIGDLETLEDNTFCGDLDQLLKGIKEHYPESLVLMVTPMDSLTIEEVRAANPDMRPIEDYIDIMISLSEKYGIDVIDLFRHNFLNSYDMEVFNTYVPGCHPNDTGYRMLGEHIAKEITRICVDYQQRFGSIRIVAGGSLTVSGQTVSGQNATKNISISGQELPEEEQNQETE